jgi:hypothetical protein
MQPRTCLLTAFTVSAAMAFGAAVMADDLPKEGTYSTTYSGFGTVKISPIGKERVLVVWDENGLTVGGLVDHMTWHCFGLQDIANGMAELHGYCVGTDPAGDQVVHNVASNGRFAVNEKSHDFSGTYMSGTGKYAGISGGITGVNHASEFRPTSEGTYLSQATVQGNYKLP